MPLSRKRLRSRSRSVRRFARRSGRFARKFTSRSRINRAVTYHQYRRTFAIEDINDATNGSHKAYAFKFNQLPNYADFLNMYDAYKIKKIIIRVEPTGTENDMVNMSSMSNKYIRVVHDYDDSGALVNESDYFEYQNMKSYAAVGKAFRIVLYPRIAGLTYRTESTLGQSQVKSRFIDMAMQDVPHYGIKIYFPGIGRNGYLGWRLFGTMLFVCKDCK